MVLSCITLSTVSGQGLNVSGSPTGASSPFDSDLPYTFVFFDSAGAADIMHAWVGFYNYSGSPGCKFIYYDFGGTGELSVIDDIFGPGPPFPQYSAPVSTSSCTVSNFSYVKDGNYLIISVNIAFHSYFGYDLKQMWGCADSWNAPASSGMVYLGTWQVQTPATPVLTVTSMSGPNPAQTGQAAGFTFGFSAIVRGRPPFNPRKYK
jgi:hypothetical protein